jgi:hypothetical protein
MDALKYNYYKRCSYGVVDKRPEYLKRVIPWDGGTTARDKKNI